MPINKIFGKTFNTLEKSLDILSKRHTLIAGNIANASTPGYKPKEINFKEALDNAVNNKSVEMFRTHPLHFDSVCRSSVEETATNQASNGLNWVDIDKEMTNLAENNLQYRTGVEVLLKKLDGLKYAITEGGR